MENLNSEEFLSEYLKEGGRIKKDCWLKPMHVRYNSQDDKYEMVDSVSGYGGEIILGTRERYSSLSDIPYVGHWVLCNQKGELLDGVN